MSYTPTEWTTGDTITAEKLNKIEGGIEDASSNSGGSELFIVEFSIVDSEINSDKTITEIISAAYSGKIVKGYYMNHFYDLYLCANSNVRAGTFASFVWEFGTNNYYISLLTLQSNTLEGWTERQYTLTSNT